MITVQGKPCRHGHTTGRYKCGKCIECKKEIDRKYKRDFKGAYKRRRKLWKQLNVEIDHDTYLECVTQARANKIPISSFIREAIEWRLEELGE